jgi:short-subunit dehydrogenase
MSTSSARPLALVTGGSSGIGLELARLFVEHGHDVVIAAEDAGVEQAAADLRQEALREGREATVEAVQVDLTTADGVERLAGRFGADRRAPDALCLNAGIGLGGPFLEQPLDRALAIVDLNVRSTVHLAHRLLPAMVARGSGRVLVTSSIAARMPGSLQAVYNASKSFTQSFAEALRDELRDTGVTVTALQPGPTDTEFFARAEMEDTRIGQGKKDDAADVARQGFEALLDGRDHVVAASLKSKLMGALALVTPEPIKAAQHRKMAEPTRDA